MEIKPLSKEEQDNCRQYLSQAIISFRLGMDAEGSDNLMKFIDHFRQLFSPGRKYLSDYDAQLIKTIVSAQRRGDTIYLADLIEYEIPKSGFGKLINSN